MTPDEVIASLRAFKPEFRAAEVARLSLFGSTPRDNAQSESDRLLAAFDNTQSLSLLDMIGFETSLRMCWASWLTSSRKAHSSRGRGKRDRDAVRSSQTQSSWTPTGRRMGSPTLPAWAFRFSRSHEATGGTMVLAVNLKIVLAVVTLTLLAGRLARAEMFGPDYQPCGDQPSTVATVDCVLNKTKAWDHRLNTAYKALMQRIDVGQGDPLKASQRLWIQFRDSNCRFYGPQEGTIRQIQAAECLRVMTQDRTLELERAMKFD